MSRVIVAATQMSCGLHIDENIAKADLLVRKAAARGARLIVLQELFETPYFCKETDPRWMAAARSLETNRAIQHFRALAKALSVVLPISFYERANAAAYNALAMIDADGAILGVYRKSHIPDGPGYREKFYFNPGDTGFEVFDTALGRIGALICWDQWFPEPARILALKGAEILCYPTAIGSEPQDPELDSMAHWQRAMQGHAAANILPIIASNRVGREIGDSTEIAFYGSSFIADRTGAILAACDRQEEGFVTAEIDLEADRAYRRAWGVFRDRRPELYSELLTLDGAHLHRALGGRTLS